MNRLNQQETALNSLRNYPQVELIRLFKVHHNNLSLSWISVCLQNDRDDGR